MKGFIIYQYYFSGKHATVKVLLDEGANFHVVDLASVSPARLSIDVGKVEYLFSLNRKKNF